MFNNIFEDITTMNLKDVYNNLITISQIKPFDKLYHYENILYIEDSYVPCVKRWYRGSSRLDTVKFIKYIYIQTFFHNELLKKRIDNESIFLQMTLLNNLKNSIKGLINLMKTYETDLEISYKIKKQIDNINNFFLH